MHRNNGPKAYKCNFVLRIIAMGRKQFNRCVTFDAGFLPSKRRSLSRLTLSLHWVCCCCVCVCTECGHASPMASSRTRLRLPQTIACIERRRRKFTVSEGGCDRDTWVLARPNTRPSSHNAVPAPPQMRYRACRRRLIGECAHCASTLGRLHSYAGQHRH